MLDGAAWHVATESIMRCHRHNADYYKACAAMANTTRHTTVAHHKAHLPAPNGAD